MPKNRINSSYSSSYDSDRHQRGKKKHLWTIAVDRISKNVSSTHLSEIFGHFGKVSHCQSSPKSNKTYFIHFENKNQAEQAIQFMHNAQIDGNVITVELIAKPDKQTPKRRYKSRSRDKFKEDKQKKERDKQKEKQRQKARSFNQRQRQRKHKQKQQRKRKQRERKRIQRQIRKTRKIQSSSSSGLSSSSQSISS